LGRQFAEAGKAGNYRRQALLLSVMRMMALRSFGGKMLFDKFQTTFGYIEVGPDALATPNLCVFIYAMASRSAKQTK